VQTRSAFLDIRVLRKFVKYYEEEHNKEIAQPLGAIRNMVSQATNALTQIISSTPPQTNGESIEKINAMLDQEKSPDEWVKLLLKLGRYALEAQNNKRTAGDSKCFNCFHAMRTYILHCVLYADVQEENEVLQDAIWKAIQEKLTALAVDEESARQAVLKAYLEPTLEAVVTKQETYNKVIRDMVYLGVNEKALEKGPTYLKQLFGNLECPRRDKSAQNDQEVAVSSTNNPDDPCNPSVPNPNIPNILHHRIYFEMYFLEKFPKAEDRQTAFRTFLSSIKSHSASSSNLSEETKSDASHSPSPTRTPESSPDNPNKLRSPLGSRVKVITPSAMPPSTAATISDKDGKLPKSLIPQTPHTSPHPEPLLPDSKLDLIDLMKIPPMLVGITKAPSFSDSPHTPQSPTSTNSPQFGGTSLLRTSGDNSILGFLSPPSNSNQPSPAPLNDVHAPSRPSSPN
jgi:hypothetical protein